jgi:hypothetical protein
MLSNLFGIRVLLETLCVSQISQKKKYTNGIGTKIRNSSKRRKKMTWMA